MPYVLPLCMYREVCESVRGGCEVETDKEPTPLLSLPF